MTRAPDAANDAAMALPMPFDAPVTSATFPSSEISMSGDLNRPRPPRCRSAGGARDDRAGVHDAVRVEGVLQRLQHRKRRAVLIADPFGTRLADAVMVHDRATEAQRFLADD